MAENEADFEWDDAKDQSNRGKHGVRFVLAQKAFLDPNRIIAENVRHSVSEKRYFCIGTVDGEILYGTVHMARRQDSYLRRGLLAERKTNL
jgi:uncharacterized DUF497 family protein